MRVEEPGTEAGRDEATTAGFGTARRPGRPRDPQADEAITSAIVDVLAEQGFSGFTVEEVAARAGVGKATIYRRWSTKEELVLAAAERVMVHVEPPDTGSLRDDLVGWYWEKFRTKSASTSDDLKKLLARFIAGRRKTIAQVVERGRARGDCGDVDASLLMDMISGTLMHRSLFGDKQLRRSDVEQVVGAALQGVDADRS